TEIYTLSLHDALPICPTFTRESALSSAQRRFTVLFGMGRSGTTSLWSSGLTCCLVAVWRPSQFDRVEISILIAPTEVGITDRIFDGCQSYRVKPHGQLVLVSLTHYCASTPSLSTSWSRTTLQGALGPGKTHLETSFPLRCFQRLSLPHLATRRCHWRDHRYTRGASTPVLSY